MSTIGDCLFDAKRRGYELGHRWARESAHAVELARLHSFVERRKMCYPQWLYGHQVSTYRVVDYLAFAILGIEKDGYNYVSSVDFWENTVGCTQECEFRAPEFLQGFIEGALQVEDVAIVYGANEVER